MSDVDRNALTVQQVARYARIHPRTVYRLAARGELTGLKVGRSWRFHRRHVEAWLRRRAGLDAPGDPTDRPAEAGQVVASLASLAPAAPSESEPEPHGLLSHEELLVRQRRREQHLNPVTGLPGRNVLDQAMEARLFSRQPFDFGLVDVNHFQAFNEAYGFGAGDRLLRRTADLLCSVVSDRTLGEAIVAHTGGDDFLLVLPPSRADELCAELVDRFDELAVELHDRADVERGYVETRKRNGQIERTPLVSLSIAIVPYRGEPRIHPARLFQAAAEIRRYLKAHPGSAYLIDRRRPDVPPA